MTAPTCQCGCGQPVGIAKKTRRAKGHVKGQPLRYLNGHGHPGRRCETCKECGVSFFPKWRKKGRDPQFCSIQCWAAYKPTTKCARCRIEAVPRGWAKHCSSCRADLERARNHRNHVRERLVVAWERLSGLQCIECGRGFLPVRGGRSRRRFCSDQCSHRFWARFHERRRRVGVVTAAPELISIRYIGDRDGWRCHICRGHVQRSDATRDHLIPVVAGGETTPENLSLAHRGCNSRRHAGRLPAQLRLVG